MTNTDLLAKISAAARRGEYGMETHPDYVRPGFFPVADSSPFADAFCDWYAHERNPATSDADTSLDVYTSESLDDFASCADSKLSCSAYADDPGLTAFAHDCRALVLERAEAHEEYDEGPTCYVCDALVSENAVSCACGAMLQEMADPCEGMTFEERMSFEVTIENEDRRAHGAPIIPTAPRPTNPTNPKGPTDMMTTISSEYRSAMVWFGMARHAAVMAGPHTFGHEFAAEEMATALSRVQWALNRHAVDARFGRY